MSRTACPRPRKSAELRAPWLLPLYLALLAGCSNYRFRDARLPAGGYDADRLAAALAERETGALSEVTWIPLVHGHATSFSRTGRSARGPAGSRYPAGFRLEEAATWGPLALYLRGESAYYDTERDIYETHVVRSVLWRIWRRRESRVATPHGTRVARADEILFGLIPFSRVRYEPDGPAGSPDPDDGAALGNLPRR